MQVPEMDRANTDIEPKYQNADNRTGTKQWQYWQCTVPIMVLDKSANMPIPVLSPFNASTGNVACQYWYWTNVPKCQYRYGHQVMAVPVMYHANTGIGQNCKYANTNTGTI
jgi:hypothetical protein